MKTSPVTTWKLFPVAIALLGLVLGALFLLLGLPLLAQWCWVGGTAFVLAITLLSAIRSLLKRNPGVDLIAVLAMAGAMLLGEHLAGAIIALMLTGGTALEVFAATRARRDLTALLKLAPRTAHRRNGENLADVDVAEVKLGDRLLVKPGEVVAADGVLLSPNALLDESALTGESRPTEINQSALLRSGGTNVGGPLEMRVTLPAADSTYAGIIRLVHSAEESKAPFIRLADRYAVAFLFLTLLMAGVAWLLSGDPTRALAVLVVATPCPLILAAPAAIMAGVSRAARYGVIVKGGGPLETLARVIVLILDKTGTVTTARPQVVSVEAYGSLSPDEVVHLAASVEQVSIHPYAPAILTEARNRKLELGFPSGVQEQAGTGIQGEVEGRLVAVGQFDWVAPGALRTPAIHSLELRTAVEGSSSVYVAVEGHLVGALLLQDPIRAEAPRALQDLRKLGIKRIYMVTGDHPDIAELVGDALGIDRVFADRTPEEKVEAVNLVRKDGLTAMVGDGINDAPALALADVGIAMGARGATAASEAADIVLTADRLQGLVLAIRIARRTRSIALQSVLVGMGLSVAAMIAAAAGLIAPVAGAILQEGIDVLVILNALRALGGGGLAPRKKAAPGLAKQLASAHQILLPRVAELAELAARLDTLGPHEAQVQLERMRDMLDQQLLPHEREEQNAAFPVIAGMLKDEDPTGPLIETHHEVQRLARLYGRLVANLHPDGPQPEDWRDLRRSLYGLNAILSLHFAQEDELYSMLEA